MNISLPAPDSDALEHSAALVSYIQHQIKKAGGWIDFAQFMNSALYAPGLGYYSSGAKKFGLAGDFVTAPEISPMFGQCFAKQVQQILCTVREKNVDAPSACDLKRENKLLKLANFAGTG